MSGHIVTDRTIKQLHHTHAAAFTSSSGLSNTPKQRDTVVSSIVSAPSSCLFTTFFLLFGARVPPVKRGLECGSRRFESAGHCE